MTDHDKMGVLAGLIILVSAVIGVFALMHFIMVLMPMIVIGAIVGGLIWFKGKS
jgi:hypothetical protein